MGISIRRMMESDTEAVVALLSRWNMAPVAPSAKTPDPERSSIHVENSFVALDGDKIVGVGSYIMLSQEFAETASLAVDPDYKGRGIGHKLQMARLREMKERGIKRVRTEADRPETINWYLREFGYKKVGTNKKKHAFSRTDIDFWTVLEMDLESFWKEQSDGGHGHATPKQEKVRHE